MRRSSLLAAALAVFCAATGEVSAAQVEVTSCGQVVRGRGYLTADLDCSGDSGVGPTVDIAAMSMLDLRGFTITGRPSLGPTIRCNRHCTILGPGTIIGHPGPSGVVVGLRPAQWEGSRIKIYGATLTGGEHGVAARRVDLIDATITDNASTGVWTFRTVIENSVITNNGLSASPLGGIGVFGQIRTRLRNSIVTGNGFGGVQGRGMQIEGSTVSGNSAHDECGVRACADISSDTEPILRDTTCGFSFRDHFVGTPLTPETDPATHNWSVCEYD